MASPGGFAKSASGQGLATGAVRQVCALAATEYVPTTLRAATTLDNLASQAMLARTGFVPTGETVLDGRPVLEYTLELSRFGG